MRAEVLLFNGLKNGRPAILSYVYQSEPTPVSYIVTFKIQRKAGTFGTVITGELPPALNQNGYLTSIFLKFERRYVFRGRRHSYLSASCSAPAGFTVATFPFARASMTFDDGRTLSATLTRSCAVLYGTAVACGLVFATLDLPPPRPAAAPPSSLVSRWAR